MGLHQTGPNSTPRNLLRQNKTPTKTKTKPMKSIPEISVDSQLLIKRLGQAKKGDIIEYTEMSKIISGDVLGKERYAMERARIRMLRDERIVFATVRKVGLRRIEDADHVGIGEAATARVRRISRKSAEKMMCADFNKLTNEQKVEFNTSLSMLGALSIITKSSTVKQLKAAVSVANDKLSLSQTLNAFKA